MLSLSLLTDSDFDSVNSINQSKSSTGRKERTPWRLLPVLSKRKKKCMQTPQSILRRLSSVFAFYLSSVKYESTALYCTCTSQKLPKQLENLVLSYRLWLDVSFSHLWQTMKVYWLLEQLVHHRKTILQNCIISAALFEGRSPVLSLEVHEDSQLANFAPASFLPAVV